MICEEPAEHAAGIIEAAIMYRIARSFNIIVVGIVLLLGACAQTGPVAAAKSETDSAQTQAQTPLAGTYWHPVEIDGNPVTVIAGARQPHIVLSTENSSVKGFAGCNALSGKFTQSADGVRFGPLITTRMACQGTGNELEARFLRALEATTAPRIVGNILELRDASGALRMRLKAGEGN